MKKITVKTSVNAPVEKVWGFFTQPEHITKWNQASEDWHCPKSESDLKIGGKFNHTMAAKDGSFSFDFEGIYTDVIPNEKLAYKMPDNRKVEVNFSAAENETQIVETFDAEEENSLEMQEQGWKAILENFKQYTEKN
ncbi:SRPBCC family protein [Flavobacterium sp. H122]|uniref:SRPBCC family protein n=1 Tax=Flavobacterium sp. H122 TaxID=2529860 RepID=UPI0010A9F93D|nr:SRPBCC family protein [Flavobacterium sp. H122]